MERERDWILVEDTARIITDLLERAEWKGAVYNIPGKQRVSNLDLLKLLGEVMGKEIKIKFVSDRPGHDRRYSLSYEKRLLLRRV